jgi:hypothetical protein
MENAAAVKQRRFHFGLERREVEKSIYKEGSGSRLPLSFMAIS